MSSTIKPVAVIIPDDLVTEIEAVRASVDLESFVCQAIRNHVSAIRHRKRHRKVARAYAGSAEEYHELSEDLADEVWLQLEQEAISSAKRCRGGRRFSRS